MGEGQDIPVRNGVFVGDAQVAPHAEAEVDHLGLALDQRAHHDALEEAQVVFFRRQG